MSEEAEMKVGIICFWDRYATPYLSKYEKILNDNGIEYDVILWERSDKLSSQFKDRDIVIHLPTSGNKIDKLKIMLLWKKKVLSILKNNKYSKIIVLSTSPGILLGGYLRRHYRHKYIFDIRDYTYELYRIYYNAEKKVIENSYFTTISSKGFESWLPKYNYVINHNITHGDLVQYHAKDLKTTRPLNFAFIGNLRLYEGTYNLLLALKNVDWIQQTYVGREICGDNLHTIKEENHINNMMIEGPFLPENKPSVYEKVHFVNSVYGSKDRIVKVVVDTAISNKLYDAATFRCPIVASEGTFLADEVMRYGLGFAVNLDASNGKESFEKYLVNYDPEEFEENCIRFLSSVAEDERFFEQKVLDFCGN